MSQDLEALTTFVEVIDRGSFTAAAQRLGVSKSLASRRITRLEAALGTRLIHRTTRGLAPTETGLAFHERCRTLLKELQDACEQAAGRGGDVSGLLRLTAPASFGQALVVPVLARLMREHPRLQIQVRLEERRLDLYDEGFDLAIRAGELPDSSLRVRPLAQLHGVVVASPAYLAAHGTPRRPADLAGHVCLDHSEVAPRDVWRFVGEAPTPLPTGPQRLRINSLDALCDLARAGAGIAAVPVFTAAAALARGELQALLPAHALAPHPISALFPPARQQSMKLRAALDALVDYTRRPLADWGTPA